MFLLNTITLLTSQLIGTNSSLRNQNNQKGSGPTIGKDTPKKTNCKESQRTSTGIFFKLNPESARMLRNGGRSNNFSTSVIRNVQSSRPQIKLEARNVSIQIHESIKNSITKQIQAKIGGVQKVSNSFRNETTLGFQKYAPIFANLATTTSSAPTPSGWNFSSLLWLVQFLLWLAEDR